MKKLTVLGVTGSIGTQTVDVVLHHQDQFEIVAMSAGHNINKLEEIMAKLPVKHICVLEEKDRAYLEKKYPDMMITIDISKVDDQIKHVEEIFELKAQNDEAFKADIEQCLKRASQN